MEVWLAPGWSGLTLANYILRYRVCFDRINRSNDDENVAVAGARSL